MHHLHRIRRIFAEIEQHLLQLGKFAGDQRRRRRLADYEFDRSRPRDLQKQCGLGDQGADAEGLAAEGTAASEHQDLIDQNETEAKILESYLPAAASADEVRAEIASAMAAGASQMGPLMKALRDKFGAGLDGKMASELAKEALAKK